jgi:hypothetical protein
MPRASKSAMLSRRGGFFPPPETGLLGMGDDRFRPTGDALLQERLPSAFPSSPLLDFLQFFAECVLNLTSCARYS